MANFVSKYTGAQHDKAVEDVGILDGKVAKLSEEIEELKGDGEIVIETLEFDTYTTLGCSYATGAYTASNEATPFSVRRRSGLSVGRLRVKWDTNKVNNFHVRCFLFNESNTLKKIFCGSNGNVTSPYYSKVVGDMGEDAWLDSLGVKADLIPVKGPFTLPVPEKHSVLLEIYVGSSDITFPDGTITATHSVEAEQSNTWVQTWVKTGIKASIFVEETKDITNSVLYTEQVLSDEQKKQARKNIGFNIPPFDSVQYGLPVLRLTGNVAGMNKDNAVTLNYVYNDRAGTATVKWQGSSSLNYPKKNYTIKFDNAFEAAEGWGEQKKYCFKANFIDHSHARNVVCAKLWGETVKSRSNVPAEIAGLVNGGAIDGFPCIIMLNGEFHGLYTWNIPKDGWMYNMGSGEQEAIVCADTTSEATRFLKAAELAEGVDFELEYVPDENNAAWVLTSLNRLINACINSNGTDLDTTIAQYLDWDSAIDYYVYCCAVGGADMAGKNYILYTFNGTKWGFGAYDMDSTFGLWWNGKSFLRENNYPTIQWYADYHRAMKLILTYKKDAFKARYAELRAGALSEGNVAMAFSNFIARIPAPVYTADAKQWPTIPSTAANNLSQIINWYRLRVAVLDKEVESL